jgi:hypothetical protein
MMTRTRVRSILLTKVETKLRPTSLTCDALGGASKLFGDERGAGRAPFVQGWLFLLCISRQRDVLDGALLVVARERRTGD